MKKYLLIGIVLIVFMSLTTGYLDSARVRNSIEPKYTIKIVTDGGNKVTYWGLGYKVVRYPAVSPKEKFKSRDVYEENIKIVVNFSNKITRTGYVYFYYFIPYNI